MESNVICALRRERRLAVAVTVYLAVTAATPSPRRRTGELQVEAHPYIHSN